MTVRYHDLCRHYGLKATRNNPGVGHENGAIESPHGHLKRRIGQALLIRGSHEFASLEDYQGFIEGVVSKINQRCHSRFQKERACLKALPKRRTHDYAEHRVLISSSSTFDLKRVTYTVPSRFIRERLYIQLFDQQLKLFHGHQWVLDLPRVYAQKKQRGRCVNYRHVIESRVRKPQAFRYSKLRDDLLPSPDYQCIWRYVDDTLPTHQACRYIVRLLHLAATQSCESALARYLLKAIDRGELPSNLQCRQQFTAEATVIPIIPDQQHSLDAYDQLLGFTLTQEQKHG